MEYTFDFVGITPVLSFFNHQLNTSTPKKRQGAAYLASDRCTLDAFLESIETVPQERGWNLDRVVDSVIAFWLRNGEQVQHWKRRLEDAGSENLLVARVADFSALKAEFESLLGES
ncbi:MULTISPECIES: hypothetical protein [unclassified Leptolyngbya]|uniref:hypothetical protein n=1 Tax=unclassified Leptolyngbya TaxID=2650499 RepID=UPI00168232BD|nr:MULTISPECIES: hypothetical protein [unclassified Leptolyngbya]MBD1911038.1 hypothetical protein [Leptolyngbya sp. FACHB-8]MBD2158296.1 hypothetical protein [Leptolyngbya sp. FACHB-16]